ncbi:GPW/gp25 family protein [Chitinimonas sp.]|uniref:GPW/gp25 family protein n=1 Tax=Chitinimonas sp. TaxID=1934313 RepID=UPI002F93AC76
MNIDFPLHFNGRGVTASTDDLDHIRDMIEQLLFTRAGERVNRPDFGCGLPTHVFAPNSRESAATLQFTVQAALLRWLGDVIEVLAVDVVADEATLSVAIKYALRGDSQVHDAYFERQGQGEGV